MNRVSLPQNEGNEPSLSMIMSALKSIQTEQANQKKDMKDLYGKIDELYDDNANYDEQDDYFDDNNNATADMAKEDDEIDDQVVEPPSKKQRTDCDNLNVASGESSNSTFSSFKNAALSFKSKEKTADKVNDDLAEMTNTFFRAGISDEKYQELMKGTLRPENCTSLTRTKVNQLVWNWLSPNTKTLDISLQQHQYTVIKAAIKIVTMLDKLDALKCKGDKSSVEVDQLQECINLALDSLGLLAQYNYKTNMKRKEIHKPDLLPEYHHLCSTNIPFSEQLYGDDISKEVKEIQDVNKVGKRISKFGSNGSSDRGRGHSNFGNRGSRGSSIRGRGRIFGRNRGGRMSRGGRGRGKNSTDFTHQN